MSLPNLPKTGFQTQSAATTNDRDDEEGADKDKDEDEDDKAETSALKATNKDEKRTATHLSAESEDHKDQPNPFLLNEWEKKEARDQARSRP